MTAPTFRRMGVDDLPAVFAVRLSTVENAITAWELEEAYGITPASLAETMRSHVQGWLCEVDGAVVGFAMADRSNGEVQVVAVLPSHERRGIGRTLLAMVCDWLFAEGHAEIWLRANPDPGIRATGFYRALGWRATGQNMGEDQVLTLKRDDTAG